MLNFIRQYRLTCVALLVTGIIALTFQAGCGSSSSSTGSSSSTSSTSSTSSSSSQAINANLTSVSLVTSPFGGTCEKTTRDTSSCESVRTALGLSGNWLSFSCNVVLGLATSNGTTTTTYADAAYVTVTTYDLPDHTSNYYPSSGSYSFTANSTTISGDYSSMYTAYTTSFPDPSTISQQSITMNIPLTASYSGSQTMSVGMVGIAIDGVGIYNSQANETDNIFSEAGSFDTCQGHPADGQYHYHNEPYAISYDDNNLIGVMRDGYWVYGRKDYDGTIPGSIANLEAGGTTSTIYKYGGHTGTDPVSDSGSTFHYHLTEWSGCYDESSGVKSGDDGQTNDTLNTGGTGTCSGSWGWVDAWFLTGHGNGGVFASVPSGLNGQTPSQSTVGIRYYYGTPGTCSGC